MIPLTVSLWMVFNSILKTRTPEAHADEILSPYERVHVSEFISDNCPAFAISNDEIMLLFKSFIRKRFYKKQTVKAQQLFLYT